MNRSTQQSLVRARAPIAPQTWQEVIANLLGTEAFSLTLTRGQAGGKKMEERWRWSIRQQDLEPENTVKITSPRPRIPWDMSWRCQSHRLHWNERCTHTIVAPQGCIPAKMKRKSQNFIFVIQKLNQMSNIFGYFPSVEQSSCATLFSF